jgi:hypothetical protein
MGANRNGSIFRMNAADLATARAPTDAPDRVRATRRGGTLVTGGVEASIPSNLAHAVGPRQVPVGSI